MLIIHSELQPVIIPVYKFLYLIVLWLGAKNCLCCGTAGFILTFQIILHQKNRPGTFTHSVCFYTDLNPQIFFAGYPQEIQILLLLHDISTL